MMFSDPWNNDYPSHEFSEEGALAWANQAFSPLFNIQWEVWAHHASDGVREQNIRVDMLMAPKAELRQQGFPHRLIAVEGKRHLPTDERKHWARAFRQLIDYRLAIYRFNDYDWTPTVGLLVTSSIPNKSFGYGMLSLAHQWNCGVVLGVGGDCWEWSMAGNMAPIRMNKDGLRISGSECLRKPENCTVGAR